MALSSERREAICAWLQANDIDPADVPLDALIVQDEDAGVIRYTARIREGGRIMVRQPASGQKIINPVEPEPMHETREAPLLVPAPDFPA